MVVVPAGNHRASEKLPGRQIERTFGLGCDCEGYFRLTFVFCE